MPEIDITRTVGYEEISTFVSTVMAQTPEPQLAAAALVNNSLVALVHAFGPVAARAILADAIDMTEVTEVEARSGLN